MDVVIHGISNCDTMKKAFGWLVGHGVAYAFRDYRAEGLEREVLEGWVARVGWEKLLNKASTTFRELPDDARSGLDEKKAIALMLDRPTMIKRPVLLYSGGIEVGFKPDRYAAIFGV